MQAVHQIYYHIAECLCMWITIFKCTKLALWCIWHNAIGFSTVPVRVYGIRQAHPAI